MEHEQRDPFAQKESEEVRGVVGDCFTLGYYRFSVLFLQMSDWDRYAAQEYELLVAEESNDGTG